MVSRPKPLVLFILDGWGYREERADNAIAQANKPCWDHLWHTYTHTLISGSGKCVGLPKNQMGNSEVGHLNMGAGRIVFQDLTRIDESIADGSFFSNHILTDSIKKAMTAQKAIHVMGLVSDGGVHSHLDQIIAFIKLASAHQAKKVYVHAFLDGRDTSPQSAELYLKKLEEAIITLSCGKLISIVGRYYAMDRDKRYERIEKAYSLLTEGKAEFRAITAFDALHQAYKRGETDEFVKPTSIGDEGASPIKIASDDLVVFMNFRADRARQLTRAFVDSNFTGFTRTYWPQVSFICLTEYDKTLALPVAFPKMSLTNIFAEYISQKGLSQLRIAETEKYAHVTFFFNGGVEKAYPLEDRILIPSPKVATYDLQPEMSAVTLTDRLIKEIESNRYDVIICNFANPDMVGHTGNLNATIRAIETIDACLARLIPCIQAVGGETLITADHGNAELMFNHHTQQPHTAHTSELVPFIYIGKKASITSNDGKLSDIAPTMLYLLGLGKPKEMQGETLVSFSSI